MIKFAQIEGGAELSAVLKALPEALARNALRATAQAGAMTLEDAAKTQLSGYMRRAVRPDDVVIRQRRGKKGEAVQSEFAVGPPNRKPWLRWLHDGTKPHRIEVRRAKVLGSRDEVFGTVVEHPGQPPRPWLMVAQFLSKDDVMRVMALKMKAALSKQVARLVSEKYRNTQIKKFVKRALS